MLRIGLTGGTGAGKSAVAVRLRERGAQVIDADEIAREAVSPGSDGLAEVVAGFGRGMLGPDGGLDRRALGRLVFADPAQRSRLNAIVHPRVARRTAELFAALPPEAVVVHDVPLLVENGLAPSYGLVVVVTAPVDVRVRRLVESRDLSEDEARARIASQADDTVREAAADVVLRNDGELAELHRAADELWDGRIVPYAENLRPGRRAQPAAPVMAPYDPTWPAQAERLAARIRKAGGELVVRVDHVGSTAVPGLAAKDVLDLQVVVPSIAAADELAVPLLRAGFLRVAGITADTPHPPQQDPSLWRKRLHAAADPGRPAHLHVRETGSAGARFALQFRDWLRADPAARADYEQEKRRLASLHAQSAPAYAAAKEAWFAAALPRVARWVAGTAHRATPPQPAEAGTGPAGPPR